MRILILFAVVGLTFGAAALGVGHAFLGDDVWIEGGTAFALTFVPAVATLAWALFTYRSAPEMQLMATLGGSGIRMAIALGGGYLLKESQPQTFDTPFLLWLLVFYFAFLATEITLVVRQQPGAETPTPAKPG